MDFEECLKTAKEKKVDLVLLGMLPEKDRESSVDFSDAYYEPGKQVLVARKSQSDKYLTLLHSLRKLPPHSRILSWTLS